MPGRRRFQLVLIKPSHYDDDGYVIRWWRALIPANSLAAVYGISLDCAARKVLGPDVDFDIDVIDESNTRVKIPQLIARFREHGNFGLLALIGVQSNQYPRALDIARPFRQAGVPVMMGGFHISGCLSMLDGKAIDLDLCRDLGVSMFAGELEGRMDEMLLGAAAGTLKPLYNYMKDLPGMEDNPVPFLPRQFVNRTVGNNSSFDAGRGCPFQCSFCTIINVQGRKSRFRSPDEIEEIVRRNWAQNIRRFFITDDNFARNREWEAIFDRLIYLREQEKIPLGLMIQVDTLCHKIPNFVEKAKRAGVTRVFIGLENVNPDNLASAKKKQNKITEYRKMLLAWKAQGILTLAGYILGFPGDTPDSVRRDIGIIQRELPIDVMEFFLLTPLPGSEDHQKLWKAGIDMDADLNKYDLEHVVTDHASMTRAQLQAVYEEAWALYYTDAHMLTLLKRAAATGVPLNSLAKLLVQFKLMVPIERVHPLQSGIIRMKHPSERRSGLPQPNIVAFYARYLAEVITRNVRLVAAIMAISSVARAIARDPQRHAYMDQALTPVDDHDDETLDLMTKTGGAKAAIDHLKKIAELTHRPARPPAPVATLDELGG